ncbi:MAG: Zn-dependent hydrolase [Actinobacteria bacterium]|nr:Zn-dependent hydrolase [Actinomycetota bacterium]
MRIFERLDELYAIGSGSTGAAPGANRPFGSEGEERAHELVAGWLVDAGLEIERDAAGNLLGRLQGSSPELPELWTGSHLDSVPAGGRLDGPLGVLAGLEAVERIGSGQRTLAVVAFRGEEVGCIGSRARVAEIGALPGAFVELHIEQGPRLDGLGAPLAVVPAIVGYVRSTVTVTGRAGHAGTTPMAGREDALVAAAQRLLAIREAALAIPDAVATVGQLEVEPGGINVIPAAVTFSVDARAPDAERLDALVAALGIEPALRVEPAVMDGNVCAALRAAIASLGLPAVELHSGAGHDAGILAAAGVPSAMLFVRSLNGGVSHSPAEHSSDEDIQLAVDALERALRQLA